ncbi:MAG: DedA family protein [Caulobacteraceae bacterium]|nr:DedA family protein [Caulobacteraceae bacterium]
MAGPGGLHGTLCGGHRPVPAPGHGLRLRPAEPDPGQEHLGPARLFRAGLGGPGRRRGTLAKRAGSGLARIEAGIAKDAFSYLLVLRLVPAAPFFVVNIAAGLVRIPLATFVLASLIGMAPGSLVYSSLGASLNHAFATGKEPNLSIIFQPQILLPLIGLALLSLLPILVRRLTGNKAEAQ